MQECEVGLAEVGSLTPGAGVYTGKPGSVLFRAEQAATRYELCTVY